MPLFSHFIHIHTHTQAYDVCFLFGLHSTYTIVLHSTAHRFPSFTPVVSLSVRNPSRLPQHFRRVCVFFFLLFFLTSLTLLILPAYIFPTIPPRFCLFCGNSSFFIVMPMLLLLQRSTAVFLPPARPRVETGEPVDRRCQAVVTASSGRFFISENVRASAFFTVA